MMMSIRKNAFILLVFILMGQVLPAQNYPQGYFRHPLDIPMELVANFGEIRPNHWHMGLDIRTQQRENLRVHAAAEGYIARVVVEPFGFGQAIYINHPNGYTTLYAHLNKFFPALDEYVKSQQYKQQSWQVNLNLKPGQFPVSKGQFIALSGNTGGSAGPHVHFEIRDTKSEKVLNELLFKFPIADAVPPVLQRLAIYDRNISTYEQRPRILGIADVRNKTITVNSDKISFAIGAIDHFSRSTRVVGIYSAQVCVDDKPVSGFVHDSIDYDETRYINAQVDYPMKARGGSYVQHLSPLPGADNVPYKVFENDGMIYLPDEEPRKILIEVKDANNNTSRLQFFVKRSGSKPAIDAAEEQLLPNNVNIFEKAGFELYTTEKTLYDTVNVDYSSAAGAAGAVSALHTFLDQTIPVHDYITVRLRPTVNLTDEEASRVIIKNISGTKTNVQKADWANGLFTAKFRQFGSFQAFVDTVPPTINTPPTVLSKSSRIVFTPKDNYNSIKNFRAELDGKWLRFTNDKGRNWIYTFDEHFPPGSHELTVRVEDEAGNVTEKSWKVRR
ncbi:MAG: peptidoglycan DD-metalloendopeptidase family protein [Flavisolibacter sp.]